MSVTRNVLTAAVGAALALSASACSGAAGETSHHHGASTAELSQEGLGAEHRAAASRLGDEVRRQLAAAKEATQAYHVPQRAQDDGYSLPPAPAPLHECISMDGHAAMGLHFINGAHLDATLDPAAPEVVIYAPDHAGGLRLVAVEYVVFEDAWKQAGHGDEKPRLFGRDLTYVPEGNAYEIPAFYQVHAWVWRNNPDGMFADHNPRVSCSVPTPHHGESPS